MHSSAQPNSPASALNTDDKDAEYSVSDQAPKYKIALKLKQAQNSRKKNGTKQMTGKVAFSILQEKLTETEQLFYQSYAAFIQKTQSKNLNTKQRKKAYANIETIISLLKNEIDTLNSPNTKRDHGEKIVNQLHASHSNCLGLAYSANSNYPEALSWFQLSCKSDDFDYHGNYLVCAKNAKLSNAISDKQYIEAHYQLLDRALEEKSIRENEYYPVIHDTVIDLLEPHINANNFDEIEKFFKRYQNILGIGPFDLMIEKCKKNPDQVAVWRKKLFEFIKNNPGAMSEGKNTDEFLMQNAVALFEHYLEKENHFEAIMLVSGLKTILTNELLNYAIFQFLTHDKKVSEAIKAKVKGWLLSQIDLNCIDGFKTFFAICLTKSLKLQPLFSQQEILGIINKAIAVPETAIRAHYLLGEMHQQGLYLEQSHAKALEHFTISAEKGEMLAMYELASIYYLGLGVPINIDLAHEWDKKSLFSGNLQSFSSIVMSMIVDLDKSGVDTEKLLNDIEMIFAKAKALALALDDEDERNSFLSLVYHFNGYIVNRQLKNYDNNPDEKTKHKRIALNLYQASLSIGDDEKIAFDSNVNIAFMMLESIQDIDLVEKSLLAALSIAADLTIPPNVMVQVYLVLAYVYNVKVTLSNDVLDKKQFRQKSLGYYQNIIDEDLRLEPEIINYFDNLYKSVAQEQKMQDDVALTIANAMPSAQSSYPRQLEGLLFETENLFKQNTLTHLPDQLSQLTKQIVDLSDGFFDNTKSFCRLVAIAERISLDAHLFSSKTLLQMMQDVSRWHLAPAIDFFKSCLIYIYPKDLSMTELVDACHAIALSGLAKTDLKDFIHKIMNSWGEQPEQFSNQLNELSVSKLNRLLYAFAILDVTAELPIIKQCTQLLLTKLEEQQNTFGFYDLSQIFHAMQYFKMKYPDEFGKRLVNITEQLDMYESSLKSESAVHPSKSQMAIFQLLKSRNANVVHEAFIPEAGRRVDYLLGKCVIQFNGTHQHYYYDLQGKIARSSPKDELCNATLKLAGYQVVVMDHESINGLDKNELIVLLKNKIPTLVPQTGLASSLNSFFAIDSSSPANATTTKTLTSPLLEM